MKQISVFKKSYYSRFLFNALIFLLIVLGFDQLIGNTLRHYYFKSTSGVNYQTTYAMDSATAEIIILGSSRANHHYIPQIFEDSLNLTCYNTGRDGNFIFYNYAIFSTILKRYNPKIIILDITESDLYFDQRNYDGLSTLLPYKNNPEIKSLINKRGTFEQYKDISAIYPFNSGLLAIGQGNLFNEIANNLKDMGYDPLFKQMKDTILHQKVEEEKTIDTIAIGLLSKIINRCKQENISLYLIQSPRFVKAEQKNFTSIVENISRPNNAIFWNYINDPQFMINPYLFSDVAHLNHDGALLYSKIIAEKIKKLKEQEL